MCCDAISRTSAGIFHQDDPGNPQIFHGKAIDPADLFAAEWLHRGFP